VIKKTALFGLWLGILSLMACSNSSYIQKAKNIESWQQSRDQLASLQQWEIRGKISIRSASELYTADLFWQQNGADLKLRLAAPFSQAVTDFSGNDEDGYLVLTEQGEQVKVDSPETITEHAFGLSLPFSELKSWIKGVPDSGARVWRAHFNDDNRLQFFEQRGWEVKILKYKQVGEYTLPSKVFLSRLNENQSDKRVDIRLILNRWVL